MVCHSATEFDGIHCPGYRLPTEAEWEYATRAGSTTPFWSGDSVEDFEEVGWYGGNSGGRSQPVGQLLANPWGLYDVHGNVFEWIHDVRAPYAAGDAVDPQGPIDDGNDIRRTIRGGSYSYYTGVARSAFRHQGPPSSPDKIYGFRVMRPLL
jgi:formylglycine-generating enzyme required for sulfatase activity